MTSEPRPAASTAGDPERPVTLKGRYRIVGSGVTRGDVVSYAAEGVASQQPVVLAVVRGALATDPEFVSAVREQAYRLAKPASHHRTLVRVYDAGVTDEGEPFVALEPVVGRSLREVLDERGVLTTPDVLRVAIQVGEGLETLHRNGVVHGELRPESVVIVRDENGVEAVKLVGVELTAARRTLAGRRARDETAAAYLAPEQSGEAEPTEAADVHALGLLILEMFTGQRPDGQGRRGPSEIPPAIARIVAKALEPGPARRYSSISLMVNDLWSVDGQPATSSAHTGKPAVPRARRSTAGRRARSDVGMATALVVALLVMGVTAAWVVRTERFARRAPAESMEPVVAASPVAPAQPTAPPPSVPVAPAANAVEAAPAPSRTESETVASTPPVEESRAAAAKPATVGAVRAPKPATRQAQRPVTAERPPADGADGTAIIDWLLKDGRSGS